jgi:hypothetical protein
MLKLILVPLLVIASHRAQAADEAQGAPRVNEKWQQIVSGVNSTGYADADNIQRKGATATMQVLIDYPKPPFDGNNLPYRSLTMRNEYQCEEGRFRVLSIASHAGNMGSGERPYASDEAGEWEAVTNASIQKELWKLACAKSTLPAAPATAP